MSARRTRDVARRVGPRLRARLQRYYSDYHIETLVGRAARPHHMQATSFLIPGSRGSIDIEKISSARSRAPALKFRRDRRPTFPWRRSGDSYPRYFTEVAVKFVRWALLYLRYGASTCASSTIRTASSTWTGAMTPVTDDEVLTHELFRTDAAQAYVGQQQRLDKLRHGETV